MSESLPRCPVKGCPTRYRDGPDRDCGGHDEAESPRERLRRLGLLEAPAGKRLSARRATGRPGGG